LGGMSTPQEPKPSFSTRRGRNGAGEEGENVSDGPSPLQQVAKATPQRAPQTMQAEEEMTRQPQQAPVTRMNLMPIYLFMVFLAGFGIATFGLVVAWNRDCPAAEAAEPATQVTPTPAPGATPAGTTSDMYATTKGWGGINVCNAKKPDLKNVDCLEDEVAEQSAVDVTEGVVGEMETDVQPITKSYWNSGLCPVNVHWHIGAEHRSEGQYDEGGMGPSPAKEWDGKGRQGFQCRHYAKNDQMFNEPYDWKHCKHMDVGETYEVHWPHSAAGACGTPNQYQTPFYDGVFCFAGELTSTPAQIGVQAQTFIVVNDESYYVPNLIDGMLVDGKFGEDMAFYTGSTTGDSRSNEMCSQYTPITWQVDRTCHMISASSFDKMCADMKTKRDDMSSDLHPHGSRPLVDAKFSAANLMSGTMVDGRVTMDATPAP